MDYYGSMLRLTRLSLLAGLLLTALAQAQNASTSTPAPVSSALNGELFYQLLLGEIQVRGDDPGAGFSLILDAARKTSDPRLYQRAVDIALQARSGESALQAARAWRQALPTSREANRYLLQILIGLNRIADTVEPLKRELATTDAKDRPIAIAGVPRYYSRASDKKLAATSVDQALADYLGPASTGVSAWTAVGRMRAAAGDSSGALEAVRRSQVLDARAEGPALLALALMSAKSPQAEVYVRKYLEGKPQPEIRLDYARLLMESQRYAEAMVQVQLVTADKPELTDAWLMRGAIELQDGKSTAAEQSFKRYVELAQGKRNGSPADTSPGLVQAYLSLAQIAEQRKEFGEAQSWLKRIGNADELINVQIRRAQLMARQGKAEEARKLIRNLPEKNASDARLKLTAEVQLLREAKQYRAAYDLLVQATSKDPSDHDLVYDLAMIAEKMGNLGEMERLLRGLITAKPDYLHAYNALGYSLAERNLRLPEARQLIQKALELAPGDPFITDSLGWVEFRSGNLVEAARILQGAFKARPDAEIAAHLGEVLWVQGKREQALAVWREGMQLNADNETLLETLKRLRVKL